jgi:hypothetical protein
MVITRNLVTQQCPRDSVIRPVRAEELQHTTLQVSTEIRPAISDMLIWHRWFLNAILTKHWNICFLLEWHVREHVWWITGVHYLESPRQAGATAAGYPGASDCWRHTLRTWKGRSPLPSKQHKVHIRVIACYFYSATRIFATPDTHIVRWQYPTRGMWSHRWTRGTSYLSRDHSSSSRAKMSLL